MNQERFDELAKGLATKSFSRRQVLKSFVAGAVLATPLSALWNRQTSAQTPGCVDTSCVESAQQAHALCIGESKPGLGKGRCKKPKKKCQQCQETLGNQMLDCGCLTINSSTATGDSTYAPCEDSCAPQTLYEQANQDFHYAALVDYLTNEGFALDGSPTLAVFQQDGTLVQKLLSSTFLNPTRPSEVAALYYNVEATTGDVAALAVIMDKQQQTLLYTLAVVDDDGQVQKIAPSASPPQSTAAATACTPDPSAGTCCSAELSQCREDAAEDQTIDMLEDCIPLCLLNSALCIGCVAVKMLKYGNALRRCSRDKGCGFTSSRFCSNNVCCGLSETGCGGTTCCTSDERCCAGSCKNITGDTNNCGDCGNVCDPGVSCIGRECKCRVQQQTCQRADDGTTVCLDDPCEAPKELNGNCECVCSPGQSAFSIQSGEPALGAISAQAAQAAVVCCDEGLEPCGDSGECCAPGECDPSTGQCTCSGGKVPCGDSGACCEPCDRCSDGRCFPTFCNSPKIPNPNNFCECECPSCTPPKKIIHLDTCTCGCPNSCIAPKVRKIPENPDNPCECVCPSEQTPCANNCCKAGETCCGDSGQCVPAGRECLVCQGGTCNNWPRGCNDNNNLFCFCMQTVEGAGVCFDERADHNCTGFQRCNTSLDCPTGQPCAVNTCCREPNNGPLFNICIKPEQQCALTTAAAPTAKAATVEGQQPGSGPTASQPA
jgi:hypothetical protein